MSNCRTFAKRGQTIRTWCCRGCEGCSQAKKRPEEEEVNACCSGGRWARPGSGWWWQWRGECRTPPARWRECRCWGLAAPPLLSSSPPPARPRRPRPGGGGPCCWRRGWTLSRTLGCSRPGLFPPPWPSQKKESPWPPKKKRYRIGFDGSHRSTSILQLLCTMYIMYSVGYITWSMNYSVCSVTSLLASSAPCFLLLAYFFCRPACLSSICSYFCNLVTCLSTYLLVWPFY